MIKSSVFLKPSLISNNDSLFSAANFIFSHSKSYAVEIGRYPSIIFSFFPYPKRNKLSKLITHYYLFSVSYFLVLFLFRLFFNSPRPITYPQLDKLIICYLFRCILLIVPNSLPSRLVLGNGLGTNW
jgi:hypothetical protein